MTALAGRMRTLPGTPFEELSALISMTVKKQAQREKSKAR